MKNFEVDPPVILFADDDSDTLAVFRHYVHSFGWQGEYVGTARDIIRAINRLADEGRTFDALVCDINFFDENPEDGPRISGVAAARAIREKNQDLPIVFVSGYSNIIIADEVRAVGGDLFQKPVNFEAVFERVAYLIHWTRSIAGSASPAGVADRRRASINRTGHARRKTDQRIEVPKILTNAAAEIRGARRIEGGH